MYSQRGVSGQPVEIGTSVEHLGVGGDDVVEAGEAVGNALLFGFMWV